MGAEVEQRQEQGGADGGRRGQRLDEGTEEGGVVAFGDGHERRLARRAAPCMSTRPQIRQEAGWAGRVL
ncbi:hypothetical protein GCM10009788_11960 [Nocardioides humi]|uniref:Uncharacterized protein n=1 Tax=Nocardioides humi TaxID=449461 RepID=A0ABN2A1A7_9ACTN